MPNFFNFTVSLFLVTFYLAESAFVYSVNGSV